MNMKRTILRPSEKSFLSEVIMKKGIHNRMLILITSLLAGFKILTVCMILLSDLSISVSYGSVGSSTVSNYSFTVFRMNNGSALEIIVLSFFIMVGLYFLQNKQKLMALVPAAGLMAQGLLYFL